MYSLNLNGVALISPIIILLQHYSIAFQRVNEDIWRISSFFTKLTKIGLYFSLAVLNFVGVRGPRPTRNTIFDRRSVCPHSDTSIQQQKYYFFENLS
jgi:hypothetical protein